MEHAIDTWHHRAACAGHSESELWFPHRGEAIHPDVERLCADCPVRLDCAEFGLRLGSEGVYGGFRLPQEKKAARTAVDTQAVSA